MPFFLLFSIFCKNFVIILPKSTMQELSMISSVRITIENIIRDVKIFRIIAEKYRNRRKRFALRFNLIAAIYNLNLGVK